MENQKPLNMVDFVYNLFGMQSVEKEDPKKNVMSPGYVSEDTFTGDKWTGD